MTSQAGAQKRFRFTLRSLLAAVTALSILLGIVTAIYRWQAGKPKAEAAKGWIVEVRGYIYHRDAAKIDSIDDQYYDDLRPVFEQMKKQKP